MEIKTLLGLPAHPLIVHGAIVLVPLVAIGTIIVACWPRARGVFGWAVAVLSVAAFGFVGLAQKTGGALANHVQPTALTREHIAMGDAVLPWAFVIMGVACTVMALQWYTDYLARQGATTPPTPTDSDLAAAPTSSATSAATMAPSWARPLMLGLAVVAVLAAVGGTVQVYRVGHSGAKATWHTVDMNGPSTGGGEQDH